MHDQEQDDLRLVFTGSNLEANYLKEMLEENGIGSLIKDSLNSSLHGGFVSGTQENSSRVFVAEENFEKAKKIADDYIESLK